MNLIRFPVSSTNIFPIANTVNGGQLVTEYNLRSRESVGTAESVEYMIGPSYVHSESDFQVSVQSGADDYFNSIPISSSALQINSGRAVINGHYFESMVPIVIDMIELAAAAIENDETPLRGKLAVGLRAFYSTEQTIAGSLLDENNNDMYEGIQIIVLPVSEFITPVDSPSDQTQITAHILLATFSYFNGVITNIVNNYPAKCSMIDASRVGNIDSLLATDFMSKIGLNPKMFYVAAGKFTADSSSIEWCNATNALMEWDTSQPTYTTEQPVITTAQFFADTALGKVDLVIPHKQIDGMQTAQGERQYFAPVVLEFPVADFNTGTPGTVDKNYTANVKNVADKVNNLYYLANGKQKAYIPELQDTVELPEISPRWDVGDYVAVGQDYTIEYQSTETYSRRPSTMYLVLPGNVLSIMYAGETILPNMTGVEIARKISTDEPDTEHLNVYSRYWEINDYYGQPTADYFLYIYVDSNNVEHTYYYVVSQSGKKRYSDPVMITGRMQLATTSIIGGFLNAPDNAVDNGYVVLDSNGHLRVKDYALLRSGTLAYQLGEDFTVPAGLTISEIQKYLDEYVNQRIAFPTSAQLANSDPNRVHIYIDITGDDEGGELNIYDIDSRFDTCICLHIGGNASGNVIINISDCQRVQIDPSIGGMPIINLYRSGLYYNSDVLDYISTIRDLSLWYERFSSEDPYLTVDGMTVIQQMSDGTYTSTNVVSSSDWGSTNPNDNHFSIAMQSITFDKSGMISGCGILVRNQTTSNVEFGKSVTIDTFMLPQGPNLMYPRTRLINPVKVTGQFISAYTDALLGYIIQNTSFSALTQKYNNGEIVTGQVAFYVESLNVEDQSPTQPDAWDANTFHYFYGTTNY